MATRPRLVLLALTCGLLLSGCELLGIEDPAKIEAAREAEGKAIGGGCRHSGRALEECYRLNHRASKAAIFAGWRDMDAYMRENNIAVVPAGNAATGKPPAKAEPAAPGGGPA
ncbi:MAG: hypothetical protein KGZ43_04590 [Sulfuritalea sp.]|nr:hypothetical protein [Sulfuritalea sp.]